jgi:1,4-alpha-glucan branching enzyme
MSDRTRPAFLEPFDLYLFGSGEHWDLYRILGAHPVTQDGDIGYRFAVWAPNAREVYLATEGTGWRWGELPLYPVGSSGVWAAFIPGVRKGTLYKYGIKKQDGTIVYKTDPMTFFAELRPGTAAVAWDIDNYTWNDDAWMQMRKESGPPLAKPMSIYEAHLGSWHRRHGEGHPYLSLNELCDQLIPYVRDMGFTHIEFMPLAEHPLDLSWGYQTGHYYAPSSRFGMPEELMHFIDRCHQEGLGIILDWGFPLIFPRTNGGWGALTARRSTNIKTRVLVNTRTGEPISSTTAGTKSATSFLPTRYTGLRNFISTGCASTRLRRCCTSTIRVKKGSGFPISTAGARISMP